MSAPLTLPEFRHRVFGWVVLHPAVLLVPVLLVPLLILGGKSPQVAIAGVLEPGNEVTISGSGFEHGSPVQLLWDGDEVAWLASVTPDESGSFAISLRIPPDVPSGDHALTAHQNGAHYPNSTQASLTTSVTLTLLEAPVVAATPDATPTPEPTPEEITTPSSSPTPPPAPTPAPEFVAAVASTAAPMPPGPMPPMAMAGNPIDCSGYPEPRVFLEAQDWWQPIPGLGGLGHIHLGMCFPLGQTVSGVVDFDLRVLLHHNRGTITKIKMQDDLSTDHVVLQPGIPAPNVPDSEYWFPLAIDTNKMPDGIRLFRFYAEITHENGNEQTVRPIWSLQVANGNGENGGPGGYRGTGWYKEASPSVDWGYLADNFDPPTAPVSGVWQAGYSCGVNEASGESPAISGWEARLDSNFHAGIEGPLVASGTGEFSGGLSIDTNGLSNGAHKLVLICTQEQAEKRHSGVFVVPFTVVN